MKTQTTHTPTPWISNQMGNKNLVRFLIEEPLERGEANAAYIIRAVNAYQPMVEAMQSAIRALEAGLDDPRHVQNCSGHESTMDCVIDDIKQALALAEGK